MVIRAFLRDVYLALRGCLLGLLFKRKGEKSSRTVRIRSILVIRIDRIGDLVVSLPAIRALKLAFPEARLSVLLKKENIALVNGLHYIDEAIPYQGFLKSLAKLRKRNFDLVIDLLMDYTLKTALLADLSKAKIAAGFDIASRGRLFNLKYKAAKEEKGMSEYLLDLTDGISRDLLRVNISREQNYPEVLVTEEGKNSISSYLRQNAIVDKDLLIGMHPGGHYPSQCWAVKKFSELADGLIKKYGVKIIIIAAAAEENLAGQMAGLMQEKALKAVGLPLDKLVSLISMFDLFICNNSGPLHIACVLNIPTVSTMGPTHPVLWQPKGEGHIVMRHELACSPCNRSYCKQHTCMELITVREMEEAVDSQMQKIKYEHASGRH